MAADLPYIQRSMERGTNGISHFIWNGATFQPEAKMTKWILNCIFLCDGVEYWYQDWLWWLGSIHGVWICVCQFTGRNNVKMAAFSFNQITVKQRYLKKLAITYNQPYACWWSSYFRWYGICRRSEEKMRDTFDICKYIIHQYNIYGIGI